MAVKYNGLLNVRAPLTKLHTNMESGSFIAPNHLAVKQQEFGCSSSSSKESASGLPPVATVRVKVKLDLILKQMDVLTSKIQELEQQTGARKSAWKAHISNSSLEKVTHLP